MDQGTNFMSQLLKELYNLLHIRPIRTSPYHPQTDGSVERFSKTLKSLLRKFVKKQGHDWDMLLPYLLYLHTVKFLNPPQDSPHLSCYMVGKFEVCLTW